MKLLVKINPWLRAFFTDSDYASESIIDTNLPVPDMSELLLPEGNLISSYSVIFKNNEEDEIEELIKTVDQEEEFPPDKATDTPEAKLTDVTESGTEEPTTEEPPFVTGETVTEGPDGPEIEGTKKPEKEEDDILEPLDNPGKKSELDDPIATNTEPSHVADYPGEASNLMQTEQHDPTEPEQIDEEEKEGDENKKDGEDILNQDEQKAETDSKDENEAPEKEDPKVGEKKTEDGGEKKKFLIKIIMKLTLKRRKTTKRQLLKNQKVTRQESWPRINLTLKVFLPMLEMKTNPLSSIWNFLFPTYLSNFFRKETHLVLIQFYLIALKMKN